MFLLHFRGKAEAAHQFHLNFDQVRWFQLFRPPQIYGWFIMEKSFKNGSAMTQETFIWIKFDSATTHQEHMNNSNICQIETLLRQKFQTLEGTIW